MSPYLQFDSKTTVTANAFPTMPDEIKSQDDFQDRDGSSFSTKPAQTISILLPEPLIGFLVDFAPISFEREPDRDLP